MSGEIDLEQPFEVLLRQFDEIVASLESDDLTLDEAIERYELAARLAHRCSEVLETAELKVRQIDEELEEMTGEQS